ncbi:MAG TPA: serine protease [Candidatus Obscuribacterales bacterium]
MAPDPAEFKCDQPLKKGEIRTLRTGEPPDACDHTDFMLQKVNGIDVLKLFKEASPNVARLDMLGGKIDADGLHIYSGVGSGVIIRDQKQNKHLLTVFHAVRNHDNNDKPFNIKATLQDGSTYHMHERSSDPKTGLAILDFPADRKVSPPGLEIEKPSYKKGQPAFGLGFGYGSKDMLLSPGIILGKTSQTDIAARTGAPIPNEQLPPNFPLVWTNMHTGIGDSGGACISLRGRLQSIIIGGYGNLDTQSVPAVYAFPLLKKRPETRPGKAPPS